MTKPLNLPQGCYQGIIPALIATASRDGTPNVTYLSQVFRIDERHVALSCQFFNKTKQNTLENPYASVQVYDPITFEAYQLELRYDHSEERGPLFDTMALRIQAIASHTGMAGVFRLVSADVYEVLDWEKLDGFLTPVPEPLASEAEEIPKGTHAELRGLQLISQSLCRARTLDELLTALLVTLDDAFAFSHSMVLLPDERGERLFALCTRGYAELGVGAEVAIGEGLIGMVAAERRPLRVSGVEHELRYGRAIRGQIAQTSARQGLRPEIPLPGLADARSQLALPLVSGERLVGVLFVESRKQLAFDEWDETFLEIVASQVAVALDNMLLREAREAVPDAKSESAAASVATNDPIERRAPEPTVRATTGARAAGADTTRRFRFYKSDDCVFAGDEYLIRNVPGRILWKILRAYHDSGRTEFSNRELRLDPWLGLPEIRDNLESRLVLLRKRLEQKGSDIRLVPTSRGHFRLETRCAIELEEIDGGS